MKHARVTTVFDAKSVIQNWLQSARNLPFVQHLLLA